MAHKYHLDPDRKVDAETTGLGNHHTLFDFETMPRRAASRAVRRATTRALRRTEFYCRSVYVDKKTDLGRTLDERAECVVDGDRKPFAEGMAPLCDSLANVDATGIYADWAVGPAGVFSWGPRREDPTRSAAGPPRLRHHVRDLRDPGRRVRHAPQHDRLRRPTRAPHRRVEGRAATGLVLEGGSSSTTVTGPAPPD